MRLNTIKPARGAHRPAKRVGRGAGSTVGKTGGRGHKGQHSRSGGTVAPGFEGGQMPLQRRLPKFGFHSRKARLSDEIRLAELAKVDADTIDLDALKAAKLIAGTVRRVKVIKSGALSKAVRLRGILVTKGARAEIEAQGGTVEN